MNVTAEQIANVLDGEVIGDPSVQVFKLAKIEEGSVGAITFLSNPKYNNYIYNNMLIHTSISSLFLCSSSATVRSTNSCS